MFSGEHALSYTDGRVFLDRNPKYFKLILDFLRDGKKITDFESEQEKKLYVAELKYWAI